MIEERITAALASVADGKRYWVRAPQKTDGTVSVAPPYVVLHLVDGVPNYHFCGRGTVASRVQANCIAATYSGAKQLARAVIAALDMYSDPDNGIQAIFIDSEGRDLPTEDSGSVNYLFAVAVDIIVHHT